MRSIPSVVLALLLTTLLAACSAGTGGTDAPIRLVDDFDPAQITNSPAAGPAPSRTEWRFELGTEGGREDGSWRVVSGVTGLGVDEGHLVGTSSSDQPLLHLERTGGTGEDDLLHAVEIRLRTSGGSNLAIMFDGSETPNEDQVMGMIGLFPWSATPLIAGETATTYTLTGPFPVDAAGTRHIFLRPVDAADAGFEIESIRLVFRREHLASFPSGVSWQGLQEVYRETLVARSPEVLRFDYEMPASPFLEMTLGTLEDAPLTFNITVRDEAGSTEPLAVSRTLTTGVRWEPLQLDLAAFAGRQVAIELALEAEDEATIGFWGTPAIRTRGGRPQTASPGESPAGVILVMVDTLRSDHLDAYGYERPTAPNLTALGESGAVFEDNISQATWTKASTPSIMTSLYPSSHGVVEFPSRLPSSATTMAEIFRSAGYATLSFSSVLFTGKFSNLHQGFETVHESTSVGDQLSAKTARTFTDRLLPWLQGRQDSPFFVFFHLFDPHDPYEPKPPYAEMWFDPAAREEHHHEEEAVRANIPDPLRRAFLMPNREELIETGLDPDRFMGRQIDWYDGSIRGFDSELGRLRQMLEELGLAEDTLIVFVSDHGEEFLDHGQTFHGHTVYGELVNVPLMMSWPGVIPAGTRVDATVQSIDILPTLLELAGLHGPDSMQGQSLVPFLLPSEDNPPRPRPAISEQPVISDHGGNPPPFDKGSRAIVWEGWKLIHNHTGRGELPEFELYDHQADPLDTQNVAEQNPEVVEELARLLESAHQASVEAALASDEEAAESMDPKELERLRALGYVQ